MEEVGKRKGERRERRGGRTLKHGDGRIESANRTVTTAKDDPFAGQHVAITGVVDTVAVEVALAD